ncbi:Response regulator MprA [Alphaproteobacteria bacterium SO-S41]|nr:Response regulator MprA [Alphaproteobacteria bacterium SO-S41]
MQLHDPRDYKIVVAEDDEAVLDLVRTRLMLAGYATTYARNGLEALKVIGTTRPSAIILDVNMPELDGFSVLKILKDKSATMNIPVMMLTARNAPQDVEKAISLGAADFLTKPFKDETLLLRVARLVRVRPAGDTVQV